MSGVVDGPIRTVIVGAGHRSLGYAEYARQNPSAMTIVGVAEPNALRRERTAKLFGLSLRQCFDSAEQLAESGIDADAAINGTMDADHVATTIALLNAGYPVLLEKPIGVSQAEVLQLWQTVQRTQRTVMVCHVLRYAPFYAEIKRRIVAGQIGTVLNIQTAEHVSYHHAAVAYVRGKWNSRQTCGSSMLMAKCCHDLDLITWLKSGHAPERVGSFGSRMFFRPERAPKDAGTRCLVDCPIESQCLYSARKLHLDHPDRWSFYVWSCIEGVASPTLADKEHSLKTDNPHGRCVWRCDNDVVDHQSVVIEFGDGATATHNMICGASRPCRKVHIMGTAGEIEGVMEDGVFVVRRPDPRAGCETDVEHVELSVSNDMHGGGDLKLVEDFVHVLRGQSTSISSTHISDSIYGHLVGFAADRAMAGHCVETVLPLA
jgi:predicted dehydrogenase